MKLYQKIVLTWFPFLVTNLVATMTIPEDLSTRVCDLLLGDVSALLAVVSTFLFRREIFKETRLFFLFLAALFFLNGIFFGLFLLAKRWLIPLGEWSVFYVWQYRTQIYFLLLSGCVVYLVVNLSLRGLGKYQKYVLAFVIVASVWGLLFYPYIADPKYLYTTSDVGDYRAIREAKEYLQRRGETKPTSVDIASHLGKDPPESVRLGIQCLAEDREARVAEILPYFRGDDVTLLVYRPLWRSCIVMALFSIVLILISILHQYLADPPKSAYMEKVLWCLLPFCCFEALHFHAYIQVNRFEDFRAIEFLGHYASLGIMVPLLLLLILRLRFIESIEGRFYERRLIQDASRVTRWRDAFDNWVLRQFMNPGELEQRFLIRHKEKTTMDDANDRSKRDT